MLCLVQFNPFLWRIMHLILIILKVLLAVISGMVASSVSLCLTSRYYNWFPVVLQHSSQSSFYTSHSLKNNTSPSWMGSVFLRSSWRSGRTNSITWLSGVPWVLERGCVAWYLGHKLQFSGTLYPGECCIGDSMCDASQDECVVKDATVAAAVLHCQFCHMKQNVFWFKRMWLII